MKKYFFKGVVSHRRVKSKKHGFDYPYRSIFLENIYESSEHNTHTGNEYTIGRMYMV